MRLWFLSTEKLLSTGSWSLLSWPCWSPGALRGQSVTMAPFPPQLAESWDCQDQLQNSLSC